MARLGNGPSVIGFTLSAALVIVTFLLAATTSADADLWGHVRFGLDMLREGRIVFPDSYSFTSDRPWINHEWLAEVVFAAAWSTAGQPGLLFVKLAVIGSVLWLVGSALTRRGVSGRALVILLALVLAATLTRVVHVRPQLFSVLFFAALASTLTRADGGARRTLAWSPAILMLWANSHGGWIVGMATLGLWTAIDLWRRRRLGLAALDAAAWATLSVLATLVNPYGLALWHFLLETVRPGREAIGEWNWIWSHPPSVLTWLLFAAMTTIALRRQARWLDALIPAFWGWPRSRSCGSTRSSRCRSSCSSARRSPRYCGANAARRGRRSHAPCALRSSRRFSRSRWRSRAHATRSAASSSSNAGGRNPRRRRSFTSTGCQET